MKESNSGGDQSEHGSRLYQDAEARRDAYFAGRDQFILQAEAAERCNCGLYAVGACHACDLPLCSQHGASISGLFLCDAHRHPAVFELEPRHAEERFRPRYVHQVRQIFAGDLLDRKAELAELSQFAAFGDGCPYVWLQGEAWAGKSALMASFVLNPPPRVRVVSFFITARFAGQSDRAAFLDAVLEQLSELLGQSVPDALTESNRQVWFLELLKQAAGKCARDAYRLVLVVDGLDEDRGMPVDGSVYSIAALLPGDPPPGTRIILAGRPDPPIPADVPAWHPMRSPAIVRSLPESAQAVIMRGDTQRELARLLDGGGLGRELLGLVVTAGGGLSSEDLADLADEPVGEIEKILHTVAGRSFTSRDLRWGASSSRVFVLAHEELQQAALRSLRSSEMTRWGGRIHSWAESYRDLGWPTSTPEYLLRGYLRMLRDCGDLPRMIALSTDVARLDRMLDLSGGDAAAIVDIAAVQGHNRDQLRPDLGAAVRLAYARADLIQRNSNIPISLPGAWAFLGNLNRADALTHSIDDPGNRALALGSLSLAVAETGSAEHAARLLDDAEVTARSIISPLGQSYVMASLCAMIIENGDLQRAENMIGSISDPGWKDYVLAELAAAHARMGDAERAMSIAMSSSDAATQASALASVAQVFVDAGDLDQARSLADDAETIARSPAETRRQLPALASAARAARIAGDLDRARLLADDAETIARSATDEAEKNWMLGSLARIAAEAGELSRAETILSSVTGRFQLASTLRSWAETATAAGDLARAESVARSIADPSQQAPALEYLAATVANNGDIDRAEAIACLIIQPESRASGLASIAQVAAKAGDLSRAQLLAEKAETLARSVANEAGQQAGRLASAAQALARARASGPALLLAGRAETLARSIPDPSQQARALASAAEALATAGELDKAEAIARSIGQRADQASALASVAQAAAEAGDRDRASRLIGDIEVKLASAGGTEEAWRLKSIAIAVAETGDLDRAAIMARSISFGPDRASALASVAQAAAEEGELEQARLLVIEARDIIDTLERDSRDWPLEALSRALGSIGEIEQAAATANSIPHPSPRGSALASLTELMAKHGDLHRADSIARSIVEPHGRGQALIFLARSIAESGDSVRARSIFAEALTMTSPLLALLELATIDRSIIEITVRHFSNLCKPHLPAAARGTNLWLL